MPIIDTSKDLVVLFATQAKATPDAPALEDGPRVWTYAELDRDSAALAERLRRLGIGRDDLVGVLLGRSADYVIACLAALRAGGAFLVLELAYPPKLLADVIADAAPKVIVTHTAHAPHIKVDVPIIILDEPTPETNGSATNGHASELPPLPADDDLDRLAFVSYSSGTTGKPKGIANPHRAPVLSYDLRFQLSDLGPGDRVACNVFFIWEILRPLLRGATVITVPDEVSYDPVSLVNLLSEKKVTETLMTPTLLATVLARHPRLGSRVPNLKTIWLNGEVVYTDLVRRAIKALPNARLLNCYSASETHEIACGDIKEMLDDKSAVCPVGPLMDPKRMYVLDESGAKKVEQGAVGELFVGGDLLARGYLNLPETTAKAFLPDPFDPAPGARMYRTGDLAKILPSGLLQITGRVGSMVKIRGYTIQIGAVEHVILKYLAVQQVAVITHGEGLERQLVAYIVRDKEDHDIRTVPVVDETGHSPASRRALADHLAQYMIPAIWVELEEMPTHEVSGKADHARLPPVPNGQSKTNGSKEDDKNIKISVDTIRQLWAESLNVSKSAIAQEHDFFDMGGHSLSLADLGSRISRTFGFPIPLPRLAAEPTLEGHLKVVRDARDGHTAAVQADLPAVMQADSVLPDDIKPSGAKFCPIGEAKTIMLTGVTGFLGAFLLRDLLENTSAQIICLVRFPNPTEKTKGAGMARLRKNLLDLGIWEDQVLDRVEIQAGNLARKRFGLPIDDFEELAARVQVIVHAGATVNLVYPYAAMRGVNVGGTREILRMASQGGATVHHISTNGVLPPSEKGWSEDTIVDLDAAENKLLDGYGQTKWVAEQLVLDAQRRGLPARIYRPGTISGHSKFGSTNTYDLVNAVLVESLHLGHSPDVPGWLLEMTPVDFVARSVVALSDYKGDEQIIFHLGEPEPCTANSVFEHIAALGYPTKKLKWDDWMARWNEERGNDKTEDNSFTVGILRNGMPTEEFLKLVTVLKDDKTRPILEKCGLQRPAIDRALLKTYIRHFYSRGWLPRPPASDEKTNTVAKPANKGPLANRVAVVVGASSGIGAAIGTALIREGALVTLAARRTDALEGIKKRAPGASDANVLTHKTDVTDRSQVEALMRAATDKFGPIDILVNCAGVMYFTMMGNTRVQEWEQTVDVNCKGLLNCLSSTVPGFLSRGKGHIVAISSDAGRKVFPGLGVYSASKFFVEATLQALRLETVGSGLRVTAVQPGNVGTDLLSMSTDPEAMEKYGTPTGAKVLAPEEVADAVVFALKQPEHVAVNEVLIEPRDEPI